MNSLLLTPLEKILPTSMAGMLTFSNNNNNSSEVNKFL